MSLYNNCLGTTSGCEVILLLTLPTTRTDPGSISEEIDHRIKGRGARCIWIWDQE